MENDDNDNIFGRSDSEFESKDENVNIVMDASTAIYMNKKVDLNNVNNSTNIT